MTEDYKKEQSILNKWFHLRAATQFANSSGISGSGAACRTPSMLTSSSTGTSFGVIVILEGIKLSHYSRITKHPPVSAELGAFLEKLGRTGLESPGPGWEEHAVWDVGGGSSLLCRGGQRCPVPPIGTAGIF